MFTTCLVQTLETQKRTSLWPRRVGKAFARRRALENRSTETGQRHLCPVGGGTVKADAGQNRTVLPISAVKLQQVDGCL